MKLFIQTILFFIFACNGFAQPASDKQRSYENRKTVSFGVSYQRTGLRKMSALLEENGYGKLANGIFLTSMNTTVFFSNRLGFYYELSGGGDWEESTNEKYKSCSLYRGELGATYRVLDAKYIAAAACLGFDYSLYTLRLYHAKPDSMMAGYLAGDVDAKRVKLEQAMINVGAIINVKVKSAHFLAVGGGYRLPLEKSNWTHEHDDLKDGPSSSLGSWYLQVRLGVSFRRQITQLPDNDTRMN